MVVLKGVELSHDTCCDLCAVTAPHPVPTCGADALSCVLVLAASVGLISKFFFNSLCFAKLFQPPGHISLCASVLKASTFDIWCVAQVRKEVEQNCLTSLLAYFP